MNYCLDCGTEIKHQGQNFCEKCGCKLPSIPSSSENQEISQDNLGKQPSTVNVVSQGGLFDISRNYYIIKETVKFLYLLN